MNERCWGEKCIQCRCRGIQGLGNFLKYPQESVEKDGDVKIFWGDGVIYTQRGTPHAWGTAPAGVHNN